MRKYGKVDANQSEIVQAARDVGASVLILSSVGNGCPDLLIGYDGINLLIEVKDGSKPPSARRLTPDQVTFFEQWEGQKCVVESADEMVDLLRRLDYIEFFS
jgi:hypothetical protein